MEEGHLPLHSSERQRQTVSTLWRFGRGGFNQETTGNSALARVGRWVSIVPLEHYHAEH